MVYLVYTSGLYSFTFFSYSTYVHTSEYVLKTNTYGFQQSDLIIHIKLRFYEAIKQAGSQAAMLQYTLLCTSNSISSLTAPAEY